MVDGHGGGQDDEVHLDLLRRASPARRPRLSAGGGGDGLSLATALYMYQNGTVYNTGETV